MNVNEFSHGAESPKKQFSLREAISFGARTIVKNPALFFGSLIIFVAIQWVAQKVLLSALLFAMDLDKSYAGLEGLQALMASLFFIVLSIVFIFYMLFSVGMVFGFKKMMLNMYDGKQVSVKMIFQYMRSAPKYFFAQLFLRYVIVPVSVLGLTLIAHVIFSALVGAIVYFFSSLLILSRLWYYDFFIIDKNVRIVDSFKQSWRTTKDVVRRIFLWILSLSVFENIFRSMASGTMIISRFDTMIVQLNELNSIINTPLQVVGTVVSPWAIIMRVIFVFAVHFYYVYIPASLILIFTSIVDAYIYRQFSPAGQPIVPADKEGGSAPLYF